MIRQALMLLLLAATPAMARGPTFVDQIHSCVETTVKYTEFATLADDSKDADHGAFTAFVQQEADAQGNPSVQQLFIHLGELAWLTRGKDVHAEAMDMYEKCFTKLGTQV